MTEGKPPRPSMFSDYASVSLLMASLVVWPAAYSDALTLLAGPLLLAIPGIVRRDLPLTALGVVIGITIVPMITLLVAFNFDLDSRWTMPLTVYLVPGILVMNPGGGEGLMRGWAPRAMLALLAYLLILDVFMLVLRERPNAQSLGRALYAMVLSSTVAAFVFGLSWIAMEGIDTRYTGWSRVVRYACVFVYILLWPAKYLLLNYLYAPALFTRPYGEDAPDLPVDSSRAGD